MSIEQHTGRPEVIQEAQSACGVMTVTSSTPKQAHTVQRRHPGTSMRAMRGRRDARVHGSCSIVRLPVCLACCVLAVCSLCVSAVAPGQLDRRKTALRSM